MAPPLDAFPDAVLSELRRHNLLQTLVQRQLIAETVAEATPEPEALEQARQQFLRSQTLTEPEALKTYLGNNGLSEADLHWQIALPLRVEQHCREHYRHKAEAHFLARKSQLDRVVYSLLRVKDHGLAQELYLRIDAGEKGFADLAAEFAEGPEKQTKGIIGPVPLAQAHPVLAEKLRTHAPGTLLQPFRIGEWWLVARLENYTPACFDDAMARQMATELFEQWVKEETALRMKGLSPLGSGSTTA